MQSLSGPGSLVKNNGFMHSVLNVINSFSHSFILDKIRSHSQSTYWLVLMGLKETKGNLC